MKHTPGRGTFYETVADSREQGGYFPEKSIFFLKFAGQKKKILDIGCNDGFFSEKLKNTGHIVTGIDISEQMLAQAKKRGIQVKKVDIESETLPFSDNSFDIVLLSDVIEHIFDTDRLLSECHRVLTPRGKLLISTPNIASLGRRFMLLFGISPYLEFSTHLETNGLPSVGHIRYYTVATLKKQLDYNRFRVLHIEGDLCNIGPVIVHTIGKWIPSFCRQLFVVAEKP